jgi:hypothetical protein
MENNDTHKQGLSTLTTDSSIPSLADLAVIFREAVERDLKWRGCRRTSITGKMLLLSIANKDHRRYSATSMILILQDKLFLVFIEETTYNEEDTYCYGQKHGNEQPCIEAFAFSEFFWQIYDFDVLSNGLWCCLCHNMLSFQKYEFAIFSCIFVQVALVSDNDLNASERRRQYKHYISRPKSSTKFPLSLIIDV